MLGLVALSPLAAAFHWTNGVATGPLVSGHVQCVDAHGRVLAFGGLTGSAGSPTTNELWAFDKGGWSLLLDGTAGGPGPRMYAAGAVLDGVLVVFGGWDPGAPGSGGSFKDEVWRLDVDSLLWSQLGPLPHAASRHTACTIGDKIVVHTFRSTLVCDGISVREQATTGEAPDGFSMCAAAPLGDRDMLVFGGSTKAQGMTANAYVLDTSTWHWRKLRPTGDVLPSPRASCAAAPLDGTTCVVFGGAGLGGAGYEGGAGLTAFDETFALRVDGDEAIWTSIEAPGPPARVAASLSPLPTGGFLLHGGWAPKSKQTFDRSALLGGP